jgi:hypothetical protein
VVRRLPKKQRNDVGMELRELIGDMAEEKGSVREALVALGEPAEFAKIYDDEPNHLIRPVYLDAYWTVLRIALLCVMIAAFLISYAVRNDFYHGYLSASFGTSFVEYIIEEIVLSLFSMIVPAFAMFGIVTLIFFIFDRDMAMREYLNTATHEESQRMRMKAISNRSAIVRKQTTWSPSRLSPVPDRKALLFRIVSIASIVFSFVSGAVFLLQPQLISFFRIYVEEFSGFTIDYIPLFNFEKWDLILPLFMTGLFAMLADGIFRLVIGRYHRKVMISGIVSGVIQIICGIVAFKILPVWMPELDDAIRNSYQNSSGRIKSEVLFDPQVASNIVLAVIVFAVLLKVSLTVYRTLRVEAKEKRLSADKA